MTKKTAPTIEISKNLEKKIQRACLSDEPLPRQQNKISFLFLLSTVCFENEEGRNLFMEQKQWQQD